MLNLDPLVRPLGLRQYGLRLDTIIRLHWFVVVGQSLTLAGVYWGLGFDFPIWPALCTVAVTAAINLYLRIRFPRPHRLHDPAAGFLLAYDVTQLTAVLYFTGGIDNPFVAFYLAPLLISATALSPRTTLLIGAYVIFMVTVLSYDYLPVPWYRTGEIDFPLLYRVGEWVAMLFQVGFIGIYTWKIAEETRQLSDALAATELVLEREQHLSALDGLAAAAAHELGTPLATIALVSRELEHAIPLGAPHSDDIRLLRQQVERCREILRRISSLEPGEAPFDRMPLSQILDEVTEPHRPFNIEIKIQLPNERDSEPIIVRNPGILYGLGNLVENAVDFAKNRVDVTAQWSPTEVGITIADDGPGFAGDVLSRIGDPYVSMRGRRGDARGGLGLGIFIAKTLLERTGGSLTVENREPPQTGAIIRVRWPREKLAMKTQALERKATPTLESQSEDSLAARPAAE